jgi:predicted phage replisome organizer
VGITRRLNNLADVKKYYWLKLKKDFFKRHDIKIIESMPNGKDYILFYLKILVESVDHNGSLRFNDTIPYDENMLSVITNTDIDKVKTAMRIFTELKMVDVMEDNTIFMNEVEKMLGAETYWAEQKRKQRTDDIKSIGQCPSDVQLMSNVSNQEIEIEIELDKELDKDIIPYQEIMDSFNQTCTSLPGIREITGPRKKAIKGRWKQLKDVEGTVKFFMTVEQSDWLSGRNDKGWSASFDWIFKAANFTKILEGNFFNKQPRQQTQQTKQSVNDKAKEAAERYAIRHGFAISNSNERSISLVEERYR